SHGAGHVGEERLGQALPGLAVGAGPCGARALSPRPAMGEQPRDGGAAGVVGAEDLSEEDPERDQRGEDAGQPASDGGQRLGDGLFGEDVGERQVAVLKELLSQGGDLFAERGGKVRAHAEDSLQETEELSAAIVTSETRFAYPLSAFRLAKI